MSTNLKSDIPSEPAQDPGLAMMIGGTMLLEALVFFLAALAHLGVRLPLGMQEPRILPATIVEGLIGLFFAGSSYAIFMQKPWAWSAAVGAHAFAVAGILLGMVALAFGLGPYTEANAIYHRVMLAASVAGLVFVLTPTSREALGHRERAT